jgi:hypothetical protein
MLSHVGLVWVSVKFHVKFEVDISSFHYLDRCAEQASLYILPTEDQALLAKV